MCEQRIAGTFEQSLAPLEAFDALSLFLTQLLQHGLTSARRSY